MQVAVEGIVETLRGVPPARFQPGEVCARLRGLLLDPRTLQPYLHYAPRRYTRNLIYRDEIFELIALCWEPHSQSPIHNHSGQLCWLSIQRGALRLENFKSLDGPGPGDGIRLVPNGGIARATAAKAARAAGREVQDAVHGVRYALPAASETWQVTREGTARSPSGVETEVSSFPLARPGTPQQCREYARARLSGKNAAPADTGGASADAPREQASSDAPVVAWSFTSGAASAPVRNRWAFFTRDADCLVLYVTGPKGDAFADQTFDTAARSFQVLPLPPERQRDVDLLAGMGFLERREPASALERFEALTGREPDNAKAHFGALMAGFELGQEAYARALPHGQLALRSERDLTPEQRHLALRAVGVMQLAENQVREAADTLAELVVRAPDLAEAQYNYACALARLGDAQAAMDHLRTALRLDGELAAHARQDEDLKSLRGSAAFEQLTTPAK